MVVFLYWSSVSALRKCLSACIQKDSADRVGANLAKKKNKEEISVSNAKLMWTQGCNFLLNILYIQSCKILLYFQVSFNILKCSLHILRFSFHIDFFLHIVIFLSDFHAIFILFFLIIIMIRIWISLRIIHYGAFQYLTGVIHILRCHYSFQSWP